MDTRVTPASDTADPTLRFDTFIQYQYRYQVPLGLVGQVRTQLGKVVGDLVPLAHPDNAVDVGILPRSNQNEPMQERKFVLDCRLSPLGMAALLEARESDPKKDIRLVLMLRATFLLPAFRMANQLQGTPVEGVVLGEPTKWGPGLGQIQSTVMTQNVVIYSSQWVSDFAPVFGVGRFMVVEVPVVERAQLPPSAFGKSLLEAQVAVGKMAADLEAGHWTECVEHSRTVAELLRDEVKVTGILEQDGLSREASEALVSTIRGQFTFASKFLHRRERGGAGPNPPLVAKKEDAFFVYNASVQLVNLLSRKAARSST